MTYAEYVYNIVKNDCLGVDAIYKDYIVRLIGEYGFNTLLENNLIESCGVVNERQLFVLRD